MAPADVDAIAAFGVPILCFDTCSILDIMRDPTRATIRSHEQQAAIELVNAMEQHATLVGVIAPQVQREFSDNVQGISEQAEAALKKFRSMLDTINQVIGVFGQPKPIDTSHFEKHVERARGVTDRLLSSAFLLRQVEGVQSRAAERVLSTRAPAQKGKDSLKDCVVIETYLEFIEEIRAAGCASKVIFVSSNKSDYATGDKLTMRAGLKEDFERLKIEYAPNLGAAKAVPHFFPTLYHSHYGHLLKFLLL